MQWGAKTIKYLLFLFNLVFVVCGITLISFGVAIKGFYKEYETFLDDRFFSAPSLLISCGAIIFFIAFFGCCGAYKDHHCMVVTFGALLGAVFVMELVAGVTGYVLSEETHDILSKTLKHSMYYYKNSTDTSTLWDQMQTNFGCCGTNNYTDWYEAFNSSAALPITCCTIQQGAIGSLNCTEKDNFHKFGCLPYLSKSVGDYAWSLGALGTSIAFIQIVGITFACVLAKSIRDQSYESV